ncbi:MAG: ATP-binding cassette domain-containing protein [Verrucomicrobiales bacterium]|nr:ATP-binding cassette domain-containing protein [Verrucomicrobiales bacterium]
MTQIYADGFMNPWLIRLQNAQVRLGSEILLKNTSLRIDAGQHWAILGNNGSGKSSLARLLAGELPVCGGTVDYQSGKRPDGVAIVSLESQKALIDHDRRFDSSEDGEGKPDTGRSVRTAILDDWVESSVFRHWVEVFALQELLEQGIGTLSTGEGRKMMLCRALVKSPKLLILDEPYAGLDQVSRVELIEILADIAAKGISLVQVACAEDELLPCISHVALLENSHLLQSDERSEVLESKEYAAISQIDVEEKWQLPKAGDENKSLQWDQQYPLIELKNVSVIYEGKVALTPTSLTIRPQEHWQIEGPNGAGKTTLLSMISGDNPQSYANDVKLFGRQRGSGESLWDIRQRIAVVSAAFQMDYRLPVRGRDVVISGFFDSIGLYQNYSGQQMAIADEWLAALKIEDLAESRFTELSYAQQRLLLLARAMVKHPTLLLIDEPCLGLDVPNTRRILNLLDTIAKQTHTQLIYVCHDPEQKLDCITHRLVLS